MKLSTPRTAGKSNVAALGVGSNTQGSKDVTLGSTTCILMSFTKAGDALTAPS